LIVTTGCTLYTTSNFGDDARRLLAHLQPMWIKKRTGQCACNTQAL